MLDFYQKMQNITSGLMKEFNQGAVQYQTISVGNGPIENPGPAIELAPIPFDAVVKGVSYKYIDGTTIVSTDLQVSMSGGVSFTPNIKGFILVDGIRHKIIKIVKKPASGIVVAYVVIFRK